jgi:hypothetical protein
MKKFFFAGLFLAAAMTTVATAQPYKYQYNFKGNGASASFNYWADCTSISAWVTAQETVTKADGTKIYGQYGWLDFSEYNWCDNTSKYGWVDLTNMTFNGQVIQGAQLSYVGTAYTQEFLGCQVITCGCTGEGSCEECDEFGNCYYCGCDVNGVCTREECNWGTVETPIAINLTWTPSGNVYHGVSNSSWRGEGGFSHSRSVGSNVDCAVSGDMTIGATNYLGPDFYQYGSSWTSISGSMTIQRLK